MRFALFAIVFALCLAASCAYAASCEQTSIYQYYGGGNNTTSSIVIELRNSNADTACTYGKFNITITIPDRIGDTSDINFSMVPVKISGRNVTWAIHSLEPGEWLTISYSVPRYVVPRVQRELTDPTFSAEAAKKPAPEGQPSLDSRLFTYAKINASPGAYFIYSDGRIAGIALEVSANNSTSLVPLDDPDKIAQILSQHVGKEKGSLARAELERAHAEMLRFRQSAYDEEQSCRVLMGTDRNKCTNYDECQYSCYSVTSFCLPIALGSGKEFINLVWSMSNLTRELDDTMIVEQGAYDAASKNMTPETLEAYRMAMVGVNRKAAEVTSSALVYWLCPAPEYDYAGFTAARERFAWAAENYTPYYTIKDDAATYALFAWESSEFLKLKAQKEAAENEKKNASANESAVASASNSNSTLPSINESTISGIASTIGDAVQNLKGQNETAAQNASQSPEDARASSRSMLFIAVGAVALALVVAIIAVAVLRGRKKTD